MTTTTLKSTNTCSEEEADDDATSAAAYSTNISNNNDDEKKEGEKQQRQHQQLQRIFVPLCGKTIDMAYLASLSSSSNNNDNNSILLEVVGIEGIRVAIKEFIEEHPGLNINTRPIITNTSPMLLNGNDDNKNNNSKNNNNDDDDDENSNENSVGKFEQFVGDNITLLKGDYFDLQELESESLSTSSSLLSMSSSSLSSSLSTIVGLKNKFDYIYDRGSMVAIEPQLRTSYVKILKLLLKPGGKILLVALERKSIKSEEATKKGPPYSMSEQIVRESFSFNDDVDDDNDNDNDNDNDTTNWIEFITLLEETDQLVKVPEDKQRYPDLDQLLETVYVIQRKRIKNK